MVAAWRGFFCRLTSVIVYFKRGYFCWGTISQKCWQDISRGGNFYNTTPISFIKAYGFYFRVGVNFAKKAKGWKMQKLHPRENFHVYSIRIKLGTHVFMKNEESFLCRLRCIAVHSDHFVWRLSVHLYVR